jgi:GT2 family glycosyltransferase
MVSFVIPVKNDADRLHRCLASIARNAAAGLSQIVVVDNGSSDHSVEVARGAGADVIVVPEGRIGQLRNEGSFAARGDLLAFVDADHELGTGWLSAALETMQLPDVGAAGALYVAPPDGTWVQRMYGALRGKTVGRSDARWLGSGNLIVRRTAFEALGGFDVTLESCEDVDFCERLRGVGWRLVADERLISIHHGDPASLTTLFRAERWRGRDNLRITLRHGLSARDVPSVLVPVVIASSFVAAAVAMMLMPFGGAPALVVLTSAIGTISGLCGLRGLRVAASGRVRTTGTLVEALAVGATYELARAAALVGRAPHHGEHRVQPQTARAIMR